MRKREPKYQSSVVTFLDILGFRELVARESASLISSKLTEYRYFTSNKRFERHPKLFIFSDSLIRANHALGNHRHGVAHTIFQEILDIAGAQADLTITQILVRGGMTIGDILFENDTVFGPAFIEAYDLESQIARYPRVILHPKVVRAAKQLKTFRHSSIEGDALNVGIEDLVSQSEDGLWYIDYMRILRLVVEPGMYETFLCDHANLIERNLGSPNSVSSTDIKYSWLARYHNKTVKEMPVRYLEKLEMSRNEFLISRKGLTSIP